MGKPVASYQPTVCANAISGRFSPATAQKIFNPGSKVRPVLGAT